MSERFKWWTYERDERSRTWNARVWLGRMQVQMTVHRHGTANPKLGNRWVLQPHLIYDRKPKP